MDEEIFYPPVDTETQPRSQRSSKKANRVEFREDREEEVKKGMDLNELLIGDRTSTFFMRVNGDAMVGAGIFNGDMIIVDRSLKVTNGKVIIALLNGEMLIRRFEKNYNRIRLLPDTNRLSPIDVDPSGADFSVWGVVTYVIHSP